MKSAACLMVLGCAAAFGQPHIENARMETRSVSGGFEATIRGIVAQQSAAAWIGYSVPIVPGDHQMCCWNNNVKCGCSLEPHDRDRVIVVANPNETVKLEGAKELVVLYRVENRQIGKIRTFTPDCNLDAGGLSFIWLNGVNSAESVRWLLTLAKDTSEGTHEELRKSDSATAALAMHADPSADQALEELVKTSQPEKIRRQAIFWLGNARGQRGYEIVSRVVREDPNDKIREHAVFALTENKDPRGLEVIASVAHNDKSPHVRGQALFWLAQRAGQKIAETAINDAIANDPETEVKKKAVFALTQMSAGEGVPLLIQVVRTNKNPEVRKQAMFWLGQSKDDRALSFIEEVLK
ncbi:MAG TPA: HEAT repeat domain-containing protein [Bryobacteraceae bacterium]|nr:HEAT repeat domain-containing protein [Bryobacteraceae bacterium]